MKILIFGADGFLGREVTRTLVDAGHDVHRAGRDETDESQHYQVDLREPATIITLLKQIQPEVIINCAGIVDPNADTSLNKTFTMNILQSVTETNLKPRRIIVMGSAAEYGEVTPDELPIKETAPLRASSGYGLSKVQETTAALEFGKQHNLPVIVARIFNPIGVGMHSKFIISRIQQQIAEFNEGKRNVIDTIYRLDATRDYISVDDIAAGIRVLVEHEPRESVYNIGSGKATSNQELVDLVLAHTPMSGRPDVQQTAPSPEPLVAAQADISRMQQEFGWKPQISLEDTIKEITDAGKR